MTSAVRLSTLILLSCLAAPAGAQTEHSFTIGRVKYSGGGDWYSNPRSLPELLAFVRRETLIDVAPTEETVELTSDKLFTVPYLYLNGHGNIVLSNDEILRLRRYLLGGGFLHADDNYGMDRAFRREIARVFPDRELVELPFDHPVYRTHFDFPNGLPKIHEHDGKPPQGFAILDDAGRVMVFYSYESDLGDGWEPESVHNDPPEKRLAALRMGTNLLAYALMR